MGKSKYKNWKDFQQIKEKKEVTVKRSKMVMLKKPGKNPKTFITEITIKEESFNA